MMNGWGKVVLATIVGMVLPLCSMAQGIAGDIKSMQSVLEKLYDEMIPLCGQLTGVGRGIAGFAALWYIASRIWRHIANAEPIDFYPLFRPFAIGFCVIFFPLTLGVINGIMKPTVTGTAAMVENSNKAVEELLKQKEEAVKESNQWKMYVGADSKGDRERWYRYTHDKDPAKEKWYEAIGNDLKFAMEKVSYNFRNSVKRWMSEVLEVLFQAAALCINTLRTFQLIVLAILGPLVFAIAVFDGFQHTLTAWLAKYLNVFLWLPVANIFGAIIGKVQENMLKIDVGQLKEQGDTFFSAADTGYLIFMIIGIVGYFTVPSVSNFIVNAGSGGAMVQKITSMLSSTVGSPISGMRGAIDAKKSYDDGRKYDAGTGFSGALGRLVGNGKDKEDGGYHHSKLTGRND